MKAYDLKAKKEKERLDKKASIRKDIKAIESELKLLNNIKKNLSTEEGEAVMEWVLGLTDLNEDPFDGSSRTYFRLGKQKVGREILSKVTAAGCAININILSNNPKEDKISRLRDNLNKKLMEENEDVRRNNNR